MCWFKCALNHLNPSNGLQIRSVHLQQCGRKSNFQSEALASPQTRELILPPSCPFPCSTCTSLTNLHWHSTLRSCTFDSLPDNTSCCPNYFWTCLCLLWIEAVVPLLNPLQLIIYCTAIITEEGSFGWTRDLSPSTDWFWEVSVRFTGLLVESPVSTRTDIYAD